MAASRTGHVLELPERLDACEAATHDDERQCTSPYLGVARRLREVKPTEDMVAQGDGLLHGLEWDRSPIQAWDGRESCHSSNRDHKVLV
jgi:hypothetical protein